MSAEYDRAYRNAASRHLTGEQRGRIEREARDSVTYDAIETHRENQRFERDHPADTSEHSDHS